MRTSVLRAFPWGRFLVVLLLVALDQWSKTAVFAWWDPSHPGVERDQHDHLRVPVAGPWFGIMLSCNPGAAFGRFGEYPSLLVFGRLAAVIFLIVLLARADRRHRVSFWAMTLVLSGAIGNLADNLGTGCPEAGHPFGLVRDFIDVWFLSDAWGWDWHFPTFNVADSCITVGAVAWVLSGFLHGEDEESAEPVPTAAP
jgi:signal peptidase II